MMTRDLHAGRGRRWPAALLSAVLLMGAVSIPAGAQSTAPAAVAPATLELWLGGTLTTSTPGTPYETWVNHVIDRFKAAVPGSDVNITLLPSNNDQLAAQVQAAFASGKVPDVMMLYSGAYTTVYADGLRRLNDYVDATPGFYDQMNLWDGACIDFDCKGGTGEIVGVPVEAYLFVLFYRKDLLQQAGIAAPPTDFDELYAQCETLAKAGIQPWVYGDRDGYTTSNMLTTNITSTFEQGDVQRLLSGDMQYTDPKFLDALNPVIAMKDHGCIPADASTREQIDASNDLVTGKAAYMEGYPQFLPYFESIRDQLGVTRIPYSGTGPLSATNSSFSGDNWVIPAQAAHPELAWEFIKLASDATAGAEMVTALGAPPVNREAAAAIEDPFVQYIAQQTQNYGMPILDSVMPNPVALTWYRELQQAFSGAKSAQDALAAVQASAEQEGP
jgi:ABC-type glycerol-3-phosphate transport system substrate-binding protein